MAIAVHDKKILFIHIPKNAGSSISSWLTNFGGELVDNIRHSALQYSKYNNYYSFCVVRNPWDRAVSLYHYSIKVDPTNNIPFNNWLKENYKFQKHWYTIFTNQVDWIQCEPNLIIRYENLESEFKIIQDKFQSYVSLPIINKTVHMNYQNYYDNWSRDFIGEFFSKDIERFGYQFDSNK